MDEVLGHFDVLVFHETAVFFVLILVVVFAFLWCRVSASLCPCVLMSVCTWVGALVCYDVATIYVPGLVFL